VSRTPPRLIAITDPAYAPDVVVSQLRRALAALPPGTLAVQLRDRNARPAALGRALRDLTRAHGAMLLVNRDVELAAELGADGVHFGSDPLDPRARAMLGEDAWLSVATHTNDDVTRALHAGADAALVSPIFASPGKESPRGTDALARARLLAPQLSIYALGGVDGTNAAACLAAGATGVAVIRSILEASDPAAVALALATR
jgi:thiamine-phosphate pyrophosphorylase